jgi:hypothetical protein
MNLSSAHGNIPDRYSEDNGGVVDIILALVNTVTTQFSNEAKVEWDKSRRNDFYQQWI